MPLPLALPLALVCALVSESTPAVLTCPSPGQVLTSFSFATFGTFSANSTCGSSSSSPSLTPLPACPTSILAQAARLCVGSPSCTFTCDCASLPSPCGCSSSTPAFPANASTPAPLLRLAVPGVPCDGVPKQIGLVATCGPALSPPLSPQPAPMTPSPTNPTLEFMPSPVLGLDNLQPHFAWAPPATVARLAPADVQSAARIVVTAYPSGAAVWDSGVLSNLTAPLYVPPNPLPLSSDTRYQWTVQTAPSPAGPWTLPSSPPARFNTGLLTPSDWSGAGWIGGWRAGTLLRKDFTVPAGSPPASRASLFVSACQYYLLYIDGVRIGARELDVAWTRFQYFRSYATYELDASSLFPPGPHTVGLALGQGFCGQSGGNAGNHTPQALLRLVIYGADGVTPLPGVPAVVTDTTWSAGSGPVLTDSTYFGEQYNASMEQPGWAAPGFVPPPTVTSPWAPAVYTNDPPTPPTMSSQLMPAIERVALLSPLSITPVTPGPDGVQRYTFDFGQQIAGRALLSLPASAGAVAPGTNVTLQHTEVVSHPPFAPYDGSAWMGNLFWAYPVDSYIAAGVPGRDESYEPAFTEHGFRYVELSAVPALPYTPTADTLTAVVLRTAARPQATLTFGHPTLQSISNASWWTESAALMGIPAGTAARGERTGWTGDAAFASESELVDFDTGAFFGQFLQQLQQLQCSDGTVPSCIPNTDPHRDGVPKPLPCAAAEGDPSWGTVYPTVAWGAWKYYGAVGLAARHYPSLVTYMNMLEAAVNGTGLAKIFCTWGEKGGKGGEGRRACDSAACAPPAEWGSSSRRSSCCERLRTLTTPPFAPPHSPLPPSPFPPPLPPSPLPFPHLPSPPPQATGTPSSRRTATSPPQPPTCTTSPTWSRWRPPSGARRTPRPTRAASPSSAPSTTRPFGTPRSASTGPGRRSRRPSPSGRARPPALGSPPTSARGSGRA
jgi:hypothetical protein